MPLATELGPTMGALEDLADPADLEEMEAMEDMEVTKDMEVMKGQPKPKQLQPLP